MNNYINYYYELYPDTINQDNENYIFILNNEKYYLVPYKRELNELEVLVKLNKEMIDRNSLIHEIILTKDSKPTILMNEKNYCLLRVYVNEKAKINFNDILSFADSNDNILPNDVLNHMNWTNLWEFKIDYFEYHIGHLIKKYPFIYKTIDYYIGLGENAITYLKNLDIENTFPLISISHKRIGVNSTLFDLYNPFNLIIDYKVRDIAEYIKDAFFKDDSVNKLLDTLFNRYKFDNTNLSYLFARLLFPSYYFDLYENVIENDLNENIIFNILKKSSMYEDFLKQILNSFSIIQVEWLNKKNYKNIK